jgi:hypothetical protein
VARPDDKQNPHGVGVADHDIPFLAATLIDLRLNMDWVIRHTLLDLFRRCLVFGDAAYVEFIPVIMLAIHALTLYILRK